MTEPTDELLISITEKGGTVLRDEEDFGEAVERAHNLVKNRFDSGKDLTLGFRNVMGEFAAEAVALSPYEVPENLELALGLLAEYIRPTFKDGFSEFLIITIPVAALRKLLDSAVEEIDVIRAWNDRKNGRDGMGFASAYSAPPDPDDDFVDLGALARNTLLRLIREQERHDEFDRKFEEEHGPLPPHPLSREPEEKE